MSKVNLSDTAYDYLFNGIVSYQFKPGTAVSEQEICEVLTISRTPVREALRRLEAEGMLNKVAKRGTFIKDLTYSDIREICEIRMILELYAIQSCVRNMPAEEVLVHEAGLLALDQDSPENEYFKADKNLHKGIMKCCLNSRMNTILDSLNTQLERLRRIGGSTPNRLPKSQQEHLEIVAAIKVRDIEQATNCLRLHLQNVEASVLEAYQQLRNDI